MSLSKCVIRAQSSSAVAITPGGDETGGDDDSGDDADGDARSEATPGPNRGATAKAQAKPKASLALSESVSAGKLQKRFRIYVQHVFCEESLVFCQISFTNSGGLQW